MLIAEFKDIVRSYGPDGFIDFIEYYESPKGNKQRLYEVYCTLGLQSIFPSAKIYDLNFPKRIPSSVVKKHNLNHITQGQRCCSRKICSLESIEYNG